MDNSNEARRFTRVDFSIAANVKAGAQQFVGSVENLSLKGMFLVTDKTLPVDEDVEITIALNNQLENGLIIDAKVARVANDGIAFVFDKIEFDTYVHLKRLIELNTGDADMMDKETENLFS